MAKYVIEDTTMTQIADSIRNKCGISGMIKTSDMAATINSITTGGMKLCAVAADEMTINAFLTANPITLSYDKELVVLQHVGTNVASRGTRTFKLIFLFYDATGSTLTKNSIFVYTSSLVAPNSQDFSTNIVAGITGVATTSLAAGRQLNRICADGTASNYYIASGNIIYYTEIPL